MLFPWWAACQPAAPITALDQLLEKHIFPYYRSDLSVCDSCSFNLHPPHQVFNLSYHRATRPYNSFRYVEDWIHVVHSRSFQLNKWISYNWLLKGTMTLINKQKRQKNLYVFTHPIEIISYLKIDSRLRLKLRVRVVVTMTHEFWACHQKYSMYLREIVY